MNTACRLPGNPGPKIKGPGGRFGWQANGSVFKPGRPVQLSVAGKAHPAAAQPLETELIFWQR